MSTSLLNRSQVNGAFWKVFQSLQDTAVVDAVSVRTRSSTGSERYSFLGAAPAASKWLGPRKTKAMTARTIDIVNDPYQTSVVMLERDLRRDQTGELRRKMAELGMEIGTVPHRLVSDLIANGTSGTAYDGAAFFSASHSLGSSGTQSNLLTASEVAALNVGTATAPTAEEAVDAIQGVISYMQNYKNDEGQPWLYNLRKFLIMVPFNLRPAFNTAVMANNLAGGETNVIAQGLIDDGMQIDVVINPRLYSAASAEFYVFAVDHPSMKPFIVQESNPIELNYQDESSDHYFNTKELKVGADWEGGAGYGEPLLAAKATLS